MTTKEDELVYDVEDEAFQGTPLADLQDRSSQMLEAREIATRCPSLVGEITVVEGRVDLINHAAHASGMRRQIVFAPRLMPRRLAVHEVSHIVHFRSGLGGRPHGPEWRGVYVDMVEIVYGESYARLLREAFYLSLIPAAEVNLPKTGKPIINLEVLTEATREVRWL